MKVTDLYKSSFDPKGPLNEEMEEQTNSIREYPMALPSRTYYIGAKKYYFDEETLDKTRLSNHLKQIESRQEDNIIGERQILFHT